MKMGAIDAAAMINIMMNYERDPGRPPMGRRTWKDASRN
jgi:hypothetical protein